MCVSFPLASWSLVPRDLPADSSRLILHVGGLPRCVKGAAADSSTASLVGWYVGFFRSHRLFDSSTSTFRLLYIRSAFCRLRSADSRRSAYLARGFFFEDVPRTSRGSTLREGCAPRGLRSACDLQYSHSMYAVCMKYAHNMYAVCMQYAHNMYAVCTQYVCSMHTVCTQYVCSMYACMLPNLSSYSVLAA